MLVKIEREAVQRIIDRVQPTLGQVWIGQEYAVNDLLTDITCLINDDQSLITDRGIICPHCGGLVPKPEPLDRKTYQREYQRRRRARAKAERNEE